MANIYETGLPKTPANHVPLTPLSFIARTAQVYANKTAVIHGPLRRNWAETYARSRRLASALSGRGIGVGDTVAVMLPNTPPMVEAHFAIPMTGAVINALNTRLDAAAIAFMLDHSETEGVLVDREYSATMSAALKLAAVALRSFAKAGDVVLVKGSRSAQMERVISDLEKGGAL